MSTSSEPDTEDGDFSLNMANLKETPSKSEEQPAGGGQEAPPSYEASAPGPSSDSRRSVTSPQENEGPTLKQPFNFPPSTDLPSYSEASPLSKPIAIPQSRPDPAAPFTPAYAPTLLTRGVPPETWHAFVKTLSAFLTAKVSAKAIAHAGDIGRHLSAAPVSFGRGVARNAKAVGQHVRDNARRGNVAGAAVGVVGGALSLTVGTVFGAVGALMAMPGTAVGAAASRPQTPRERATAYAAVANRDWLRARGLSAAILDTQQLCRAAGVADPRQLLEEAGLGKEETAAGQLQRLERYFCEVQVEDTETLEIGAKTLWLVVNRLPPEGGV